LAEDLAVLRLDEAGGNFEQRRLARTVAPDQGNAVTGSGRELGSVEQRRAAEAQHDPVEIEKRWSHAL
jgi:hypothetical protein